MCVRIMDACRRVGTHHSTLKVEQQPGRQSRLTFQLGQWLSGAALALEHGIGSRLAY